MKHFLLSILILFSCSIKNGKSSTSQVVAQQEQETTVAFEKPKSHTFTVDNVKIATDFLVTNDILKVAENKLKRKISYFPDELSNQKIVDCYNNAFIETIQQCYDQHRPLVLSPDAIWLTICQGVSIHINENHKQLESLIFHADKPEKLEVRNDSLEQHSSSWASLVSSLSEQTKKYTKDDFYSFFVADFSTTTIVEKTAFQITLLEGYKKTFQYVGDTGCGIPSIRISGTPEDWKNILKRLEMLPKLGLSDWAEVLKPVINEFILASEEKPTVAFWKDIYKNSVEYGAFYLSGWMIKFFPYIVKIDYPDFDSDKIVTDEIGRTRVNEVYYSNPFLKGDDYLLATLTSSDFPSGISNVPITWNNHFKNETKQMEVFAGFFGIKQYDDKSLEPLIAWAVCEKNASFERHELAESEYIKRTHEDVYWTPNIISKVTDFAVYDIKTHKTSKESIIFLKNYIRQELNKSAFKSQNFSGDILEFVVLSNGKITNVSLQKNKDKQLNAFLTKTLQELPKPWFPALAYAEHAINIMEFPEEKVNKIKIKVNSNVKIAL